MGLTSYSCCEALTQPLFVHVTPELPCGPCLPFLPPAESHTIRHLSHTGTLHNCETVLRSRVALTIRGEKVNQEGGNDHSSMKHSASSSRACKVTANCFVVAFRPMNATKFCSLP